MDSRYIHRSEDHRYTFDGVTYPGVTSILKVLDKSDGLMAWAAKLAAEAAVDMAQQGALMPLLESVGRDGTIKALTSRSGYKRDEAAALGSRVHELADALVTGRELPAMSEQVMRRVDRYAEWWAAAGWRVRVSEALLINPGVGYGGTLDLLAYDRDGRTVLADLKTGRLYKEAVLQLAAYSRATWAESDGALYAMPKVDRYVLLNVTDDGVREVEVSVGELELEAWSACLQISRWVESMKGKRL